MLQAVTANAPGSSLLPVNVRLIIKPERVMCLIKPHDRGEFDTGAPSESVVLSKRRGGIYIYIWRPCMTVLPLTGKRPGTPLSTVGLALRLPAPPTLSLSPPRGGPSLALELGLAIAHTSRFTRIGIRNKKEGRIRRVGIMTIKVSFMYSYPCLSLCTS